MNVDKKMVEYYHDNGQMPDWIYYQLNDKSAEENYIEQHKKIRERILKRYYDNQEESRVEKEIETKLEITLEKALEELLKEFNH